MVQLPFLPTEPESLLSGYSKSSNKLYGSNKYKKSVSVPLVNTYGSRIQMTAVYDGSMASLQMVEPVITTKEKCSER